MVVTLRQTHLGLTLHGGTSSGNGWKVHIWIRITESIKGAHELFRQSAEGVLTGLHKFVEDLRKLISSVNLAR